jgi:adenylate cyclase
MSKEIERRFLISSIQDMLADQNSFSTGVALVRQGYILTLNGTTVRVRSMVPTQDVAESRGYITIKGKRDGAECNEYEAEIPYRDAKEMLVNCVDTKLVKHRYSVTVGGVWKKHKTRLWSVDDFRDVLTGLMIAEVEFEEGEDINELYIPPWCIKEITGEHRYSNLSLSKLSSIKELDNAEDV